MALQGLQHQILQPWVLGLALRGTKQENVLLDERSSFQTPVPYKQGFDVFKSLNIS